MLAREEMSKDYVDGLLNDALCKIEFGDTVMGVIDDPEKGLVFIGRRDIEVDDSRFYYVLGVLGPLTASEALERKLGGHLVERSLDNIVIAGKLGKVAAIVADSYVTFSLFYQGLIIGNCLGPVIDGFADGIVLLKDDAYRLLAYAGNGVLGIPNNAAFVDTNLSPIDPLCDLK